MEAAAAAQAAARPPSAGADGLPCGEPGGAHGVSGSGLAPEDAREVLGELHTLGDDDLRKLADSTKVPFSE
eukprot:2640929-Pyramimonas_sp.AAC.1